MSARLLRGNSPLLAKPRPSARLLHHRVSDRAVVATIDDAGTLHLLRLETVDHPELDRLSDRDKAMLQGAVLTLHRRREVGNAA